MAKTRKNPAKEAHWRKYLARFAESGLSVREFCKRERLAESAFYFWRRTIGRRENENNGKPAFVKAVIHNESECKSPIVLKSAGGLELRLPSAIPAARLAELVRALETRAKP